MDNKEISNNNNLENQSNPNLGNTNTDVNSNLNTYNASQEFSNDQTQIQNDNGQYMNPYVQSNEENPYYNPYFQNTDIGSSPYIDSNENAVNLFGMGDNNALEANENSFENGPVNNNQNSINTENTSNDIEAAPISNDSTGSTTDVNTKSFPESEPANNAESPLSPEPANNNFETESISQTHINPILNQSISQNNSNASQNGSNLNGDNSQVSNITDNLTNNVQNTQNTYGSSNDQEFKNTWMGKLYDKANRRKFSIPAFFFGGLYYLYMKLYLFGFIFLIISCIIPIIGSSLIVSNVETGNAVIPLILTFALPIIVNIIYGFAFYPLYNNFVSKKLQKLKDVVQSPTQLIDEARKSGGTSIRFLLLGIVLNIIIYAIALSTIFMTIMSNFVSMFGGLIPQENENANTLNNNVNNEAPIYQSYNFYNDYTLDYDSSKWVETSDNKLTYDNYTFSYIQSIENLASVGFDINQNDGRSNFFTYLYNLFSSQIDASTTTLELGSSSFAYDNGIYYSYFDLVYVSSIERCYFVLIPEKDIFIEFILSNTDTVIPDEIHNEVVSYMCSITDENAVSNTNTIQNSSVVNEVDNENTIPTSGTSNEIDYNSIDI